jgi:hypothetical protein
MKVEYKIVHNLDAIKEKYPSFNMLDDHVFGWSVYQFVDDKPFELIGWDGGEPEDQILVRDWEWVVHALNKAYQDGTNNK